MRSNRSQAGRFVLASSEDRAFSLRRANIALGATLTVQMSACLAPQEGFILGTSGQGELDGESVSAAGDGSDPLATLEGGSGGHLGSSATGSDGDVGEQATSAGSAELTTSAVTDESNGLDTSTDEESGSTATGTDGDSATATATDSSESDTTDSGESAGTSATSETATDSSSDTSDASSSSEGDTTGDPACGRELCVAYNDQATPELTWQANPVYIATRFTLAGAGTREVVGVEVFTGEATGQNSLQIWSDLAGVPSSVLAAANWSPQLANGWQGVDFSEPVEIVTDAVSWIVWVPVAGQQANLAQAGTVYPMMTSSDAGASWGDAPTPRPPMLRVYCCQAN